MVLRLSFGPMGCASGCGLLPAKCVWRPLAASQMLCLPHPRVGKTAPPTFTKNREGQVPYPSPDRATQGLQRGTRVVWRLVPGSTTARQLFPSVFLHPADELLLWHDHSAVHLQPREASSYPLDGDTPSTCASSSQALYHTFPPQGPKTRSFRCSSSPRQNRFAGFLRGSRLSR